MTRQTLTESRPVAEATPVEGAPGRFLVQLITPGWGSSGYYSNEVLEAAAGATVFPAGTHMYLDHPTESEQYERPERSVRDLAAVLAEDARWDGGALVAEATVFGPYREVLEQMSESIGVSIRASAEVTEGGEAEGRRGRIIDELVEGTSVDFVTHAGRGGRIVDVLESARAEAFTAETALAQLAEARNIGQWIESRLHLRLTEIADDMFGDGRLTRDERIALSSAVGDGLQAFTSALEDQAPELYNRDLWDEPIAILTAEENLRTENRRLRTTNFLLNMNRNVREDNTDVPVTRPGSTTATTTEESEEDTMPQIEEARLRELEEASGRVPTLEAERDTAVQERDTARRELAETRRTQRAREIVGEAATAASISFTPLEERGLLASLPTGEDGALDETAFRTSCDEAATSVAEARGDGTVTGFGRGTTQSRSDELSESDVDDALSGAFGTTVKGA